MKSPDWRALTGQGKSGLVLVGDTGIMLHEQVLPHWLALVQRANEAGFGLGIASGWRGFDRQLLIWNGKATGQRPVLDDSGKRVDVAQLPEDALLFAILRWSAIPGCSRHHWGTDIDVYDAAAVAADYVVQLAPAECSGCGPFAALHDWLDQALQQEDTHFFRPYAVDRGGIAPERWHLSCAEVAAGYEALLDEGRMIDWIMSMDIALKDCIRKHWHEIYHRYVLVAAAGIACDT